jgi:outer membrane protein insertion porin family/translocation and assembly module TamA
MGFADRRSLARLVGLLMLVTSGSMTSGCSSQRIVCSAVDLSGCAVDRIAIENNEALTDDELLARIATAETGGVLEGIPILGALDALTVEYERFDRFVVERDLARIERLYRAKGYYEARVRTGRVRRLDRHAPGDVRTARIGVEIVVEEGPPVRPEVIPTEFVTPLDGSPPSPEAIELAANLVDRFRDDATFTEARYEEVRAAIERALAERGHAYARVVGRADIDLRAHVAYVSYRVDPGPPCTIGRVTFAPLGALSEREEQLRDALGFEAGDTYSPKRLEDAEAALSNLGVFGSVAIRAERAALPPLDPRPASPQPLPASPQPLPASPGDTASPGGTALSEPSPRPTEPEAAVDRKLPTAIAIRVEAQPGSRGELRAGAGLELGDQIAARAIGGFQSKDWIAPLDRFNFELRPRVVAYPWRLSTLFGDTPEVVPEASARLQYSLPIPGDPRTTAFLVGQASVGLERNLDIPARIRPNTDIPMEYLAEQRVGAERRFFGSALLASLSHNLLYTQPFSWNLDRPPGSAQSLIVSFFEGYAELDLRRGPRKTLDRVNPARGVLLSLDAQLAGYFAGGDANDVRVRPEIRFFAPLVGDTILAGRFATALLVTSGYGTTLDTTYSVGRLGLLGGDEALRNRTNRDLQILEKRALFSGGPSSNRGYGYNEIAPHRVLGDKGELLTDPDAIGGRTLWEASIEARVPLSGELGGTLFIDASDVTAGIAE